MSRKLSVSPRRLAVIGLTIVALSSPSASADGPTDWANPSVPGSLTDSASISEMIASNIGATGGGATQYCASIATTPVVVYDPESYTGAAVVSRVKLVTTGSYCYEYWQLQYYNTRDRAWYTIGTASANGGQGTYYVSELRGHCIAGTWLYRVKAHTWSTTSVRHTCSDPNDPFRIDS